MQIIQCKLCNKPFQTLGNKICGNCLQEIEEALAAIKDYLYDHSEKLTAEELAKETGVSEAYILHLIKEGRIEIDIPGAGGVLTCRICNAPIREGTMCNDCRNKLSSTLSGSLQKASSPENNASAKEKGRPKMHIDHSKR